MSVLNYLLFFTVILLANIMQGITGFAGTILAMPFSLMLVGYPVAKPVLNVLGLLSGVYVFIEQRRRVQWKEVFRIAAIMTVGILLGIYIKELFSGKEQILTKALGVFVIILGVQGIYRQCRSSGRTMNPNHPALYLILPLAGIVHGIFVSGGPLLISYLTRKLTDKTEFRATISTVWIVLNSIILLDDFRSGYWNTGLFFTFLISVPFLLAAMRIGSILYRKMSQHMFMILTYVLLAISGVSLLLK